MRGSSIYTLHALCTALISLSNNPLELTSTRSQNITTMTHLGVGESWGVGKTWEGEESWGVGKTWEGEESCGEGESLGGTRRRQIM